MEVYSWENHCINGPFSMAGWWYTYPSEKYLSVGMIIPNLMFYIVMINYIHLCYINQSQFTLLVYECTADAFLMYDVYNILDL